MLIGIDARILINKRTGVGRYTYQLIKALSEMDEGNRYIIFHNSDLDLSFGKENFSNYHFPVPLYDFYKEQLWLTYHVDKLGLDLLHAPMHYPPLVRRCRTVYTIHDLNPDNFPEMFQDKSMVGYFGKWRRLVSRWTDRIITPSHHAKGTVVEEMGVSENKVDVTHLGCDDISRGDSPPPFLNGFDYILYVGHQQRWKNIERLIRVYASLVAEGKTTEKLVMAGEKGWFYFDLEDLVRRLKVEDKIIFTGYISDEELAYLYRKARLFVFPSLMEGFGLPVLEAMSYGAPVVSSKATSLAEVVGEAGLLFDPTDEGEMKEKVHHALRDEDLRKELVKKGLERSKGFTWKKTAKATIAVYERALYKSRGARERRSKGETK